MVKFRAAPTDPAAVQAFVDKAKTGDANPLAVQAGPVQGRVGQAIPPELNPRVMRQVNISMPETDHYSLKELCKTIPNMSMQKFILEAIAEKAQRVGRGIVPE